MPDSTPRGRPRSEARTADILWAAAQLFASRGVAQASTREIAAAAQTTERTLFKHFGSKEKLVRAVVEEAVLIHLVPVSLQELGQAIAAFAGDLQAWHCALLQARMKALSGTPELTRLLLVELLRDEALRAEFAGQWQAAAWNPLVELFRHLQAGGNLRSDVEAATLARGFLSLNLGFLASRLVLAPAHTWDDEAEIEGLARLFAAGATAQPLRGS
ncbi:MAG: helix-turn-helix domain containing protein [Polaromonas sp.]|uniref:TetR/AcrR family transcriptional regulator n=1 Tax=Polaromonas sp. TaxID=1869339 RepID=UPI002487064D|nr:TetR/AcrR family transcriptional regulator [Polaromonas sp.]MDI1237634.1 helix-turn-helix domain containing protein [Polaromonas sp.]MDI1340107.1 helix-turn-helix domain containing protein [Polaromonas sp.]